MGVALTNILKVSTLFNFTIKMMADIELAMGSVERIKEYIEKGNHEREWRIQNKENTKESAKSEQ